MLTIRENLLETIHGGNPDRFVNQFEFMQMVPAIPFSKTNPRPNPGEHNVVNAWGVTRSWPEGTPGPFPVHTQDKIVIQDIEHWKDYVKVPNVVFSEEEWLPAIQMAEAVDRKEKFCTAMAIPGIFEQVHYLCEIQNTMMYFYTNPDEMHELIDCITEFELDYAAEYCKYIKPDALFHHDDWGSQISTFISPDMFREFIKPAYEKVYGYYKSHGVELIVHHSDSYAATLVPDMIDMGIDIWQGVMSTNNPPELIKKYGGKISFMGCVDSAVIDHPHWNREQIREATRKSCDECGKLYHIPGASQGGDYSTYDGVYQTMAEEIDAYSKEVFK